MPTEAIGIGHRFVGEASKTIDEFCEAERISRAKYFKLRKDGRGPAELRLDSVVRITPQAHAAWRRKFTARAIRKA
jgi:hypothetical protein